MTTLDDLIHETRVLMMTGQSDTLNVLDIAVNNTTSTIQVQYPPAGLDAGSRIALDLEECYVFDVNGSGPGAQLNVLRGHNGTVAASHLDSTLMYVNPAFPASRLAKYINQTLDDLSGEGIYQVKSVQIPYNATTWEYELTPTDVIEVWRVRYDAPDNEWHLVHPQDYYVDQAAATTEFSSGKTITFKEGGFPGRNFNISYFAPFNPLVNLTDDVTLVSGLHAQAHQLLSIGAAIYALSGRDVKRTFLNRQPEPRRADEVPPGAATNAIRPLYQMWADNLAREQSRFTRMYPRRM